MKSLIRANYRSASAAFIVLAIVGCGSGSDQTTTPAPASSATDPLISKVTEITATPLQSQENTPALILFEERSAQAGLKVPHYPAAQGQFRLIETMGGGVGLLDFNRDGHLDIFLCQGADIPAEPQNKTRAAQLYKNNGNGTFTDVAAQANVAFGGYGQGLAVGDYDGDGFDDIYIAGFQSSALYRNKGDGTFEELSEKAGLKNNGWATSAAFADLDADGDLDLYVVRYLAHTVDAAGRPTVTCNALPGQIGYCPPLAHSPEPDSLYRNNGDGTFTDIGPSIGLSPADGNGLGLAIADFDDDGRPDIFVANDKNPCRFYHNLGQMKFEETGLAWGLALNENGEPTAAMGVAVGDTDDDGRLDILVTNFYEEGVTLYRNLGQGRFEVATSRARLKSPTRGRLGFGTGLVDFDNDTHLDLFITNGHVNDVRPLRMPYQMPPQLFRSLGSGRFQDTSTGAGPYFNQQWLGRAAAFGDFNNDGRVDILVTHNATTPALLVNRSDEKLENHSLRLQLKPESRGGKAVSPVGAVVTVKFKDDKKLVRHLVAGSSYLSSHDSRMNIGVGTVTQAVGVQVKWPSGRLETWPEPPLDKLVELAEGQSPRVGTKNP